MAPEERKTKDIVWYTSVDDRVPKPLRRIGDLDEMHELPIPKCLTKEIQNKIKKEFNIPVYIDLDAVTTTGVYHPTESPKPKDKVYLTTRNPYMSRDWKRFFDEHIKANPHLKYFDTDVASLYPTMAAYEAKKKYHDEMDAMRYCFDELNPRIDTYDWMAHSPDEIIRDMQTILNRRKCAERYFEYDEWVWEMSSDIMHKLSSLIEYAFRLGNPDELSSVFSIYVRPVRNKKNHIELVRKVKKEEDMTLNEKLKEITKVLELVADRINARVYTKYHGSKYTLEFVFVEKGTGYTYTVEQQVDDLMKDLVNGAGIGMYKLATEANCCFHAWNKKMNPTYKYSMNAYDLPQIDQVIFNTPATIVYWKDGTKTVVQARGEMFDPEKGLAMAISKKAMGNTRDYYIPFKKWLKKFKKKEEKKEKMPDCTDCLYEGLSSGKFPCAKCLGCFEGNPNRFTPRDK